MAPGFRRLMAGRVCRGHGLSPEARDSAVAAEDRRRYCGSAAHPSTVGVEVQQAVIVLWEASDRLCSKRLKPIIPVLLPALERHGQLEIDETIRALVLAISPATIDRLLLGVRPVARGGRRRRAGFRLRGTPHGAVSHATRGSAY
jgi:hypothetical protein